MHLTYRRTCRACGSAALRRVIDLGEQHLQSDFHKPGETPPAQRPVPLALVRCDPEQDERACGLLQLSVTVPPALLYSRYWYRSGTNRTMTEHLRALAREVQALVGDSGRVLDIGCNDGTLLAALPPAYERIGIDPSDVAASVPAGIRVVRGLFPSASAGRAFDAVASIACFYDLEDPVAFARGVHEALAPNGVWIFEQSYMPRMLEQLSYDTICHEHLEYYSLATIERVLAAAGMRVWRAEMNDINGGSIRCYAARADSTRWREEPRLTDIRRREFDLRLDTDAPYAEFSRRMWAHRAELLKLVVDLKSAGAEIHVYGASTKGNTLLQFCSIDRSLITCAADRNPAKWGARTVGTDIPIVSEEDSRAARPTHYLVLPWHFRQEFVERERALLEAGTRMIFPLPAVEVVEATRVAVAA